MSGAEASEGGQASVAASFEPARASPRRKSTAGWIALLLLVTFTAGIAAALFAFPQATGWWRGQQAQPARRIPAIVVPALVKPVYRPADAARQDLLATRMAEIEDRIGRVNVEAQAAAGNAGRAEGLLIAFAARRALDSGAALGYVEGQLRLRFGQAQPRAVATIINAAREPVTLLDLQAGLEDIAPRLRVNAPGTNWWTAVEREVRELVVIRKATTPSLEPDMALPRIRRLLAAGRVEPAMAEVERLPGKVAADRWLQIARRYREARRALDLIETAAILESRPTGLAGAPLAAGWGPIAPR